MRKVPRKGEQRRELFSCPLPVRTVNILFIIILNEMFFYFRMLHTCPVNSLRDHFNTYSEKLRKILPNEIQFNLITEDENDGLFTFAIIAHSGKDFGQIGLLPFEKIPSYVQIVGNLGDLKNVS